MCGELLEDDGLNREGRSEGCPLAVEGKQGETTIRTSPVDVLAR